jgi:hypothetical protein
MSSPVLQALVNAELQDAEQHALTISAAVAKHIGPPPEQGQGNLPDEFAAWCERKGVKTLPARPASVALFVLENGGLGVDALALMVLKISQFHLRRGQADPTSGYPVATALNRIAKIDEPRSWPKEKKARFTSMPYDLQKYVAAHEGQREKEIRRAHNDAATARRELAAIQKPAEATNGIQSQPAAA